MPITLYHVDWCPDCLVVRRKLADLGLDYHAVIVPDIRRLRTQVHQVSGQYYVPVLQDGDLVLTETADILTYLEERYGSARTNDGTTQFRSQARTTPASPETGDEYPSCRID
ncbi:MAG: glutathione S-transferase N-terminal domain-containing protein [Nitrospira sp.]|nr:glutathione S-transferase N-terminal domain-containing protein [Nitrospira sp.]MCP9441195.1 glutathione S-transferase N-terminal domain-containing protein [Nitrospira sp.]